MASTDRGMPPETELRIQADRDATVEILRKLGEPLPEIDTEGFGAAFDRFGDARIVLLGESSHGTHEFYAARAAITRRLIEHHGFNIVAVEGDWPDIARIDDYVRHNAPRPQRGDPFLRFPTWMWRNEDVLAFADWLRGHNAGLPPGEQAGIHGMDVYSLGESIHAVFAYLDAHDPVAAADARRRYGRLGHWEEDPQDYGKSVVKGHMAGCETEVVDQLRALLHDRMKWIGQGAEAWFDAEQNARIVRAAEGYYRAMYRGGAASWNLRDRHMFGTVQRLMAHRPDARAVIWAHNSHVGNASATAMGWRGEFNIGELVRAAWREDAVLIGFGTDHGTVAAASDWGAPMEVMQLRPARAHSWEEAFCRAGHASSLTDWRGGKRHGLDGVLSQSLLERAVGVIYRPQSELSSHYFEAVLADQFDAWVWFTQTRAVMPLGDERPCGAPETWPFGL